ncbi:MAG TPA: NAD(P)H-dependent oxidoreductase subunit E, partial [Kofleriaceae bacterium]|nr:NAD(P)H-dependent oxidoreductase subunit E [Kofleriaceae bacterium]
MADRKKRSELLALIADHGGLRDGVAREVARETGVPEAEVYGAGSFFHLLADPDTRVRVCTGLSCAMAGAHEVLARARSAGMPVEECSCLAACDRPTAVLLERETLAAVTVDDIDRAEGDWKRLRSAACPERDWRGEVGPAARPETLAMDLLAEPSYDGAAYRRALELGAEAVIGEITASGLQGRGGAGFPAAFKWKSVRGQAEPTRYVVLNADEGEPGTFKDRDVMVRRPDLVIEGLAIAARM